jgi:tetratricopeptide (TPR) repeat protein
VARRGARVVGEPAEGSASSAWRGAVARARGDAPTEERDWEAERARRPRPTEEPEDTWILDEDEDEDGDDERPGTRARPEVISRVPIRNRVPAPVLEELAGASGAVRGAKLAERLGQASHAYDRERYQEALRMVRPLAEAVPGSAAVRELYGLTLYRMGRWVKALKELDTYRTLSGSYDQHPVIMDSLRALHRYSEVAARWEELRQASPSAEVVAEGRIVMAGALADQGDLPGAIRLLEKTRTVKKPKPHHLRQWYALADLYERAGDIPRARDLFNRVASIDPDAFDIRQRVRALR